jgi:hypothetical protein
VETRWTARLTAFAATVALSFALQGCQSSTQGEATVDESSRAEARTTTAETTAPKQTELSTPEPTGTHRTIQDYIVENDIAETIIKRGDPGPTISLPVPDGWKEVEEMSNAPYGAIIYQNSKVPENPPRVLALLSKLTGDVDPEEILALAPGELNNIPGFDGSLEGNRDSLGGYDAVQLGGSYDVGDEKGMIAQKTVVIPAPDGVYVLQLNAYSSESESDILGDVTAVIDEQTTITP